MVKVLEAAMVAARLASVEPNDSAIKAEPITPVAGSQFAGTRLAQSDFSPGKTADRLYELPRNQWPTAISGLSKEQRESLYATLERRIDSSRDSAFRIMRTSIARASKGRHSDISRDLRAVRVPEFEQIARDFNDQTNARRRAGFADRDAVKQFIGEYKGKLDEIATGTLETARQSVLSDIRQKLGLDPAPAKVIKAGLEGGPNAFG